MKHFFTLTLFLIGAALKTSAQHQEQIKTTAEIIAKATINSDFKTVVRYTYPKVLKMMGGEKKMIETMDKGLAQMKSQGTAVIGATIGIPGKTFDTGGEQYAVVPEKIVMQSNGVKFFTNSSLLAISLDKGKNWYFIDAGNISQQNLKILFPNFPKGLVIPKQTKPEVIGNL